MKKIISERIERFKEAFEESTYAPYREQLRKKLELLCDLRIKHPALDYANELLETMRKIASWGCDDWEGYETPEIPRCGECQGCWSQALIAKIEGKK